MGPGSRAIGPPAYREVEFASAGVMLRGRLYGEASSRPPGPAIVMAHGLSATISGMVADLYAEAFAAAGLRVLLYDHRSFASSFASCSSLTTWPNVNDRVAQDRRGHFGLLYPDSPHFTRTVEAQSDFLRRHLALS